MKMEKSVVKSLNTRTTIILSADDVEDVLRNYFGAHTADVYFDWEDSTPLEGTLVKMVWTTVDVERIVE